MDTGDWERAQTQPGDTELMTGNTKRGFSKPHQNRNVTKELKTDHTHTHIK